MRLFSHFTNIISCWQLSLFLHLVSSTGIPSLSWLLNTLKIQKVLPPAMWLTLFETDIKVVTRGPKCPTNCLTIDHISQLFVSLTPKILHKYFLLVIQSIWNVIAVLIRSVFIWCPPPLFPWLFQGMFSNFRYLWNTI